MNDNNVERNWLIRTSQNQILGPVAKSKVIEFLEKGALGLTDEVTSGNGYWFHLREKDLVEKYLYGDIPQSYNPISEAKSTLKLKANPDKTTSINASPANATQVINLKNLDLGAAPKKEDLEYPDITVVHPIEKFSDNKEQTKLPSSEDLEFPDITVVSQLSSQVTNTKIQTKSEANSEAVKKESGAKNVIKMPLDTLSDEEVVLPPSDDLEYPDMDFINEVKAKPVETGIASGYKMTSNADMAAEEEVTFEVPNQSIPDPIESSGPKLKPENTSPGLKLVGKQAHTQEEVKVNKPKEPQKLLTERKVKSKEVPKEAPEKKREISPELKNRNDSYLFIIFVILLVIIVGAVFYYYRFILNKPLPV